MSEATVRSQVRFSEKTDNDPLVPLVTVDEVKTYYGITDTALDIPLGLAVDVVSAVVRSYVGRILTYGGYTEVFTDVFEPKIERYLIETPIDDYYPTNIGSLLNKNTGRIALTGGPRHEIGYDGGYDPIPADLRAVCMELTRQQMSLMGYTTIGNAGPADAPKEKAVWVGNLKVEYAISATTAAALATGMGALSDQALKPYAGILDKYLSYRRLVAT